nr:hypothetical protein [Tanacetum cinerariifolium]
AENRLLMLEKGMYDSWRNRIMLYTRGKKNVTMLIDSIENGPFQLKEEITAKAADGITDITRAKTIDDLSPKEKLRYDDEFKAVNIILLGLPVNINTLINHYQTAKEI